MFKVGDKVRAVGKNPEAETVYGLVGVIVVDYDDIGWEHGRLFGVEWDGFVGGHNCGGHASARSGWNLEEQYLVKVSTFKGNKHATAS